MRKVSHFKQLLALGGFLLMLSACNMLTGADDVTFYDDAEEVMAQGGNGAGGPTSAGSGGSADASTSSSGSGTNATTGSGNMAGTGGGASGPLDLADGIDITRIALYQGVERPLMENGTPSSAVAPVVAQREALLRVFYRTRGEFDGGLVTARLTLGSDPPLEVQIVPSGTSTDGDLDSTINFELNRTRMTAGTSYRVELLQASGSGSNDDAAYPTQGQADLQVETGGRLKVTVVPIQYNGDGSGRMPDLSASQIQLLEDGFYQMYPITSVQLTVRAAIGYNGSLAASGSGWSTLLNALADLRQSDNAPDDVYYYGVVKPASTSSAYCGGGCVAGLGFTAPATSTYHRTSVGLGYSGSKSVEYALHEIGHNHGRGHAPCGTSGSDTSFPYAGGGIGGWGYDLLTGTLKSPSNHRDLMGYCQPRWISDHNFAKLFDRIKLVDNAFINIPPALKDLTWDRLLIHPDGTATPVDPITLGRPPFGEEVTLTVHTATGPMTVTGQLTRYDHVDGGLLFLPPTAAGPKQVQGVIDGIPLDAWLP